MLNKARGSRLPLLSVALISATALAYEILLIRIFSIIQWHNFAYMIISLALLGYGASGTFLSLILPRIRNRFAAVYVINIFLFSASLPVCFLLAQSISFNAEELLWDLSQFWKLMAVYVLLSMPFFFGATAIGLALDRFKQSITRLYGWDLVGASIGSLGVIGLLYLLLPMNALLVLGVSGTAAFIFAIFELVTVEETTQIRKPLWPAPERRWRWLSVMACLLLFAGLWMTKLDLSISPYKPLNDALRIPGAEIVSNLSSPLGYLSLVANNNVPLRHAPGLSLNATTGPPDQVGVFTDGGGLTAISRFDGDLSNSQYLDQTTSALAYHLNFANKALILGAGGGTDVLQALYHGVGNIDAVELNPQIVELMQTTYREYTNGLYTRPDVKVHVADARGYVAGTSNSYDLIQIALLDSFSASAAGLFALSESNLYTVEALQTYLKKLTPGGMLSITRWIKMPPRDTLKLFATAIDALRRNGVSDPGGHLLLIRGWQTSTLLVKNGVIDKQEIDKLRHFCRQRSFDTAYFPGVTERDVNIKNILDRPYYYQGAIQLLGGQSDTYMADYKFNLRPAVDDRPYFFQFFKWSTLPEIFALRGRGGMPLLEWGYLILIVTLIQAIIAGVVLILLPLWFGRALGTKQAGLSRGKVFIYFFLVGLAFLLIEIPFIHKFILFLQHPTFAVAVVLTSFLFFAGLGSNWSTGWANDDRCYTSLLVAVTGIVFFGGLYVVALDAVFSLATSLPITARIALCVALIAPLGFFMGIPFAAGLAHVGRHGPDLVPWAWGINGCASVVSAVLATLLAIHLGFNMVILTALALYAGLIPFFPTQDHVTS